MCSQNHLNFANMIRSVIFKLSPAFTALLLLAGCSKSLPVNFSCQVNGSAINGNGNTELNTNTSPPSFEVLLNGTGNTTIILQWYGIDSVGAIASIVPKTYNIPFRQLPPYIISATLLVNLGQATYRTAGTSGTVTVSSNSGPGGSISGTFSFDAINTYNSSDSVVVTQGSFTNIPVISR